MLQPVRRLLAPKLREFVESTNHHKRVVRGKNDQIEELESKIKGLSNQILNLELALKIRGKKHDLYPSFADALKDCASAEGYDNSDLAKTIAEREQIISSLKIRHAVLPDAILSLSTALFCISARSKGTLNVIDYGGSAGGHYFYIKQILGDDFKFNWHIVETTSMAKWSKPLENDELKFYDNFADAIKSLPKVDLIYSSSTIQYLSDPYEAINKILSIESPFIFLNRTGFTRGDHDVISIQKSRLKDNGHGPLPEGFKDKEIQYPFTYIQKSEFDKLLSPNYEEMWSTPINSGFNMVNEEPIFGNAMLFKRKCQPW